MKPSSLFIFLVIFASGFLTSWAVKGAGEEESESLKPRPGTTVSGGSLCEQPLLLRLGADRQGIFPMVWPMPPNFKLLSEDFS